MSQFIPYVDIIKKLLETIKIAVGNDKFAYHTNNPGQIRLSMSEVDGYRKIVNKLEEENFEFYTYQLKTDRALDRTAYNRATQHLKATLSDEGNWLISEFLAESDPNDRQLSLWNATEYLISPKKER